MDTPRMPTIRIGDDVRVPAGLAHPRPVLSEIGASWARHLADDVWHDGTLRGRVVSTGEVAGVTYVDIEWFGVDVSGNFAERHYCRALADHVTPDDEPGAVTTI